MSSDRIRFLKRNDFCYGMGMEKIETIEIPALKDITINDAIEYFNLKQYFDDGARANNWTEEQYRNYLEKSKKLFGLCMRFFNLLDDSTIIEQYKAVDVLYESVFWELFDKCKLYDKISETVFWQLILDEQVMPEDLFSYETIVKKYDCVLKEYLISSGFGVRILIRFYEQDYSISSDKAKLYLPSHLTGEDICKLISDYIAGEAPNTNDLLSIFRMKPTKRIPITDPMRLSAKQRYEKEIKRIFEDGHGVSIPYEMRIAIANDQEEVKIGNFQEHMLRISYSKNWLCESLDYPSILNNFLYLFEYADVPQMRCNLVNRQSNDGILELITHKDLNCLYPSTTSFQMRNSLAKAQILTYYAFLQEHGIQLESVIKWFFTEYLQSEFGCPEIRVVFPSENTSYAEKCSTLCDALDSLLKQFKTYVENREINFELLEISSGSVKYGDIPSLVGDKYIYEAGNEIHACAWMLFSDQSLLRHVDRFHKEGKEIDSFYELICKEKVFISDYRGKDLDRISFLVGFGVIETLEDGQIIVADIAKVAILRDLFLNEVISKKHYPKEAEPIFIDWIAKGLLRVGNSLLSEPEVHYFNYLLNDTEYVNGPKIRNKYSHGIMQMNPNESVHQDNFYTLLSVFIILAIKINDDFCLNEQQLKDKRVRSQK